MFLSHQLEIEQHLEDLHPCKRIKAGIKVK